MKHTTAFASELTWPDYDAAVRHGQTPILIPIGSMEQHGHHMPLHVDVLLPTEFARRVALEVAGWSRRPSPMATSRTRNRVAGIICPAPPAWTAPRWSPR
jgi:hypothetical protein